MSVNQDRISFPFYALQRVDELQLLLCLAIGRRVQRMPSCTNLLDWLLVTSRAISISDLWLIGDRSTVCFPRGYTYPFSDATAFPTFLNKLRRDGTVGFRLKRIAAQSTLFLQARIRKYSRGDTTPIGPTRSTQPDTAAPRLPNSLFVGDPP